MEMADNEYHEKMLRMSQQRAKQREAVSEHAPDCVCHVCQPYDEWLSDNPDLAQAERPDWFADALASNDAASIAEAWDALAARLAQAEREEEEDS